MKICVFCSANNQIDSEFIALPGGLGTLDEVFTVAASATIGYHHKSVILYNMGGDAGIS